MESIGRLPELRHDAWAGLSHDDGFDVASLLANKDQKTTSHSGISDFAKSRPDVLFETTSLNPETGQPAIDYLRASLEAGVHTITQTKVQSFTLTMNSARWQSQPANISYLSLRCSTALQSFPVPRDLATRSCPGLQRDLSIPLRM